jgi:catechol 2,3-dioxygenase-like lactoylglutathione lyase family enzyme
MSTMPEPNPEMNLGAFSVSLSVKDIHASRAFYEALGFRYKGGDIEQNWIILQNGVSTIGLFQGLFEGNLMTFNPGWDQRAEPLEEFTDIRELQRRMKAGGLSLMMEADETTSGPASLMLTDPDGNVLLFDQHVQ